MTDFGYLKKCAKSIQKKGSPQTDRLWQSDRGHIHMARMEACHGGALWNSLEGKLPLITMGFGIAAQVRSLYFVFCLDNWESKNW